jgi:hypothetical protein
VRGNAVEDSHQRVEDLNGLLRLMMKSGLERMLDTEVDLHLGQRPAPSLADESAADATASATASAEPPPKKGLTKKSPSRRNGRS